MKTLILILALNINSNFTKSNEINIITNTESQQYVVKAYLVFQGQFVEGTISLQRSQYGYRPLNYDFSGIATRQTTGQFYPDSQFIQLNPNSQYALRYNFTHCISIPNLGTAYVTL